MLLAPLAIAPSVMVAASAAERRCGPAVAGWLVAAPFTLAVALVALGPAGGAVAASAAAHVPAQVAFALAFAAVARRGAPAGFAAGVAAYVAVAVALPEWAGLAAAVPAVAAGARLAPIATEPRSAARGAGEPVSREPGGAARGSREPVAREPGGADRGSREPVATEPRGAARGSHAAPAAGRWRWVVGRRDVLVRAGVAVAFVAVVCSATAVAGPRMGGAIAAFPAMSGSLALLVHRAEGAPAAVGVLRGLVRGLGGYFAFAATAALLAPSPAAIPVGVVACGVAGRVAWRAIRPVSRNGPGSGCPSERAAATLSA